MFGFGYSQLADRPGACQQYLRRRHAATTEHVLPLLNVGARAVSSGDWFIYDFSRVYVLADRPITPKQWLDRLAEGKSTITNGPLLEFTVDERPLGSVLDLAKPAEVAVRGRCVSRLDFKRIELVQNGRVVRTVASEEGRHFVAHSMRLPIDGQPVRARTPPPPVKDDAELQEPVAENELGGPLFAHTSPIYVKLAGKDTFDAATAEGLVAQMKSDLQKIQAQAVFDDDAQRQRVSRVYQEAIDVLQKRLNVSQTYTGRIERATQIAKPMPTRLRGCA
jgi:hypothetical protein